MKQIIALLLVAVLAAGCVGDCVRRPAATFYQNSQGEIVSGAPVLVTICK